MHDQSAVFGRLLKTVPRGWFERELAGTTAAGLGSLAILAIMLASHGVVFASEPGPPGSDERRAWCEGRLEECREISRQPGFLGGPRKFCNDETDGPDCVGVCEQTWGTPSSCLTDPNPRSNCTATDCAKD